MILLHKSSRTLSWPGALIIAALAAAASPWSTRVLADSLDEGQQPTQQENTEFVEAGMSQLEKALEEAANIVEEVVEDQLRMFKEHFDRADVEKVLRTMSDEMESRIRKIGDEVHGPQANEVSSATVGDHVQEIVHKENLGGAAMLESLRKQYKNKYHAIQEKTDAVQTLAEQLGTLNNETIASEQRIRRQELQSSKVELDRLRRLLNEAIGELTLLQINAQFGTSASSEHTIEVELAKDAQFLSLRYRISELKDHLDALAGIVRPGSPALNQLQQEIAFLQRKRDVLREALTPRVVERIKNAEGESDMDRQKAMLLQRATAQQINQQVLAAEQVYQRELAEYRELGGSSADLEVRLSELEDLRADVQRIRSQIQAFEVEHAENTDLKQTRQDEQNVGLESKYEKDQRFDPTQGADSKKDVESIVRQMRILLQELEKATSEIGNRTTP